MNRWSGGNLASFVAILRSAAPCTRTSATLLVSVTITSLCLLAWTDYALRAEEEPAKTAADGTEPRPKGPSDDEADLKLPDFWPEGHPVPEVKSNCVRCHLNAGRELTVPVVEFAHSVHDLNQMSCHDCHGGNTEDDAHAHEEEFDFIGTKLSAHIANCTGCHEAETEVLAAGPHHWDWSKRINIDYPMCFDCHGNHDVGNPPEDFKLKQMCTDCHEDLDQAHPHVASVVDLNDRLAQTLIRVRREDKSRDALAPEEFAEEVGALRNEMMKLLHAARELTADEAKQIKAQGEKTQKRLEAWLDERAPQEKK